MAAPIWTRCVMPATYAMTEAASKKSAPNESTLADGTTMWSVTHTESRPHDSLSVAAAAMLSAEARRRYVGRTTPTFIFGGSCELEAITQRIARVDSEAVLPGDERGSRQLRD